MRKTFSPCSPTAGAPPDRLSRSPSLRPAGVFYLRVARDAYDFLVHATVATTENYYINTKPAMRVAANDRKVRLEESNKEMGGGAPPPRDQPENTEEKA